MRITVILITHNVSTLLFDYITVRYYFSINSLKSEQLIKLQSYINISLLKLNDVKFLTIFQLKKLLVI